MALACDERQSGEKLMIKVNSTLVVLLLARIQPPTRLSVRRRCECVCLERTHLCVSS